MKTTTCHTIDEATFHREVLEANVPVLVEFGAEWCGPCRALEPILERLALAWGERRKVGTVDIDASPNLATRFAIRGAPTILVFSGGKEVGRHVGLTSQAKLDALVDAAVGA